MLFNLLKYCTSDLNGFLARTFRAKKKPLLSCYFGHMATIQCCAFGDMKAKLDLKQDHYTHSSLLRRNALLPGVSSESENRPDPHEVQDMLFVICGDSLIPGHIASGALDVSGKKVNTCRDKWKRNSICCSLDFIFSLACQWDFAAITMNWHHFFLH